MKILLMMPTKKEIKKEIIETKKAYKNLYSTEIIDHNKDTEIKENNVDEINNNPHKTNIIKINLSSLEFEQNK